MKKNLSFFAALVGVAANVSALTITPATGGSISADKAANSSTAAWTTLGSITITEAVKTEFGTGTNKTLVLKAPAGFQFNSPGAPVVSFTSKKDITAATVAITSNLITVTLTVKGITNSDALVIKSVQVRPSAGTPLALGNIYRPSSTNGGTAIIAGITTTTNLDGSGGSNFGLLQENGGTPRRLVFTTSPAGASAGAVFTTQPVIKTQDQFGNFSTNGLVATVSVITSLNTGTGPLLGTRTNNIGSGGAKGTLTHTNLQISTVGTNYQLKATATGFTNALSAVFSVTKKIPAIGWGNPSAIAYGTALSALQLNATSSVLGSFTYSPVSGTVLPAGSNQVLKVTFFPTDTNTYTTNVVTVSINVAKAALSVTANNATRAYGVSNPAFSGSVSGVLAGDNITATYASTAVLTSPAGSYPIVPTLVDPLSRLGNYSVAVTNGTLTVQAASVATLSAQWTSNKFLIQIQGATNPVYTIQALDALGATWTNLGDPVLISNKLTLSDTNVAAHPKRFYRAILK
jgi:hypothetical protein